MPDPPASSGPAVAYIGRIVQCNKRCVQCTNSAGDWAQTSDRTTRIPKKNHAAAATLFASDKGSKLFRLVPLAAGRGWCAVPWPPRRSQPPARSVPRAVLARAPRGNSHRPRSKEMHPAGTGCRCVLRRTRRALLLTGEQGGVENSPARAARGQRRPVGAALHQSTDPAVYPIRNPAGIPVRIQLDEVHSG